MGQFLGKSRPHEWLSYRLEDEYWTLTCSLVQWWFEWTLRTARDENDFKIRKLRALMGLLSQV